jgi:hypothetical protein
MGRKDYTAFREVAERDSPKRPVSALVAIIGRGGGKDSIASALATEHRRSGRLLALTPRRKRRQSSALGTPAI